MHNIKYCKIIDYLEWVIKHMSERKDLNASPSKITQVSKAVAKLSELKAGAKVTAVETG